MTSSKIKAIQNTRLVVLGEVTHCLQHRSGNGGTHRFLGAPIQFCKKFVDGNTSSLRKVDNREMEYENKGRKGINTSLAAKGALAHCLQRCTAFNIKNGCQGALKCWTGSGKVSTPRFLGVLSNIC